MNGLWIVFQRNIEKMLEKLENDGKGGNSDKKGQNGLESRNETIYGF
jgi:hypothetical protein